MARDVEREYAENVGREPVERFPEDHPERWQWDYAGRSSDDRERLTDLLGGGCPPEEVVEVHPDQLALE